MKISDNVKTIAKTLGVTLIIVLILGIISYFTWTDSRTSTVQGTITDVSGCIPRTNKSGTRYSCDLEIEYNVNGTQYKKGNRRTERSIPMSGTPVTVYYDPSKPDDITLSSPGIMKWIWTSLSVIALLIGCGIAILQMVYMRRNAKDSVTAQPQTDDFDDMFPGTRQY